MSEFKFVTVLKTGGEYAEKHVEWLQRQVRIPIYCITDSKIPMHNVTSLPMQYDWPGWWSKMAMFNPSHGLGRFLYSDLDTVFLDGIPEHYQNLKNTVVLADVSKERSGREPKPIMNSGLMYLSGEENEKIWRGFKTHAQDKMAQYHAKGDQGYIDEHLRGAERWQKKFPGEVLSYKSNVSLNGYKLTGKERVIVFHGKPRPWDHECSFNKWIPTLNV